MATHLAIYFILTATFSTIFADNNIDNQMKSVDQQLGCECADVKCEIDFDLDECQQMGGKMILRSYDDDKCQCCDHCVVLRSKDYSNYNTFKYSSFSILSTLLYQKFI